MNTAVRGLEGTHSYPAVQYSSDCGAPRGVAESYYQYVFLGIELYCFVVSTHTAIIRLLNLIIGRLFWSLGPVGTTEFRFNPVANVA